MHRYACMRVTGNSKAFAHVDGSNGAIKTTTPNTGRLIVGAGVSTLAPIN